MNETKKNEKSEILRGSENLKNPTTKQMKRKTKNQKF